MDAKRLARATTLARKLLAVLVESESDDAWPVQGMKRTSPAWIDGQMAPDLLALVSAKRCFTCGRASSNWRRGACVADYQAYERAIAEGKFTAQQLHEWGVFLLPGTIRPGPKGRTFTPPGTHDPFAAGTLPADLAQEAKEHAAKKKPKKRRG